MIGHTKLDSYRVFFLQKPPNYFDLQGPISLMFPCRIKTAFQYGIVRSLDLSESRTLGALEMRIALNGRKMEGNPQAATVIDA